MDTVVNRYIEKFLEAREALAYCLESIEIRESIQLKENEMILIEDYSANEIFSYCSADEHYASTNPKRITQNLGHIMILSGSPVLSGTKITITKYKGFETLCNN